MKNRDTPNGVTDAVSGGKIKADSVDGSIFLDYSVQNGVYYSVITKFGSQSFDMERNFLYTSLNATDPTVVDQTRLLTASPDGDSFAAAATIGRAFQRGGLTIDPRLGVTFDRISIDSFAEVDGGNQGAGPNAMQLAFGEQKVDSLRTNLGVQISNNVNTSFGSVRPTASLDWYHEFEDDAREILVKYAIEDELAGRGAFTPGFQGCVSCFSLLSDAPDSDFFVLGAGVAAAFRGGLQGFVMFEGLLGYKNLNAYAMTAGLRGQF
jgi:outer membrane autotransporter protein